MAPPQTSVSQRVAAIGAAATMGAMWRSLRCGLGVLLAAPLVAACGADVEEPTGAAPTATPTTSAAGETVTVEVERSRLFEQQRSLGVTVRNGGPDLVVVDRVRLGAGPYEPGPDIDRAVTVPGGATVSFPVPYGDERCDDAADELVVHVHIDGDATTRSVPVSAQVRRAHARACAAAAAREAVTLRFDDDWELAAPRQARGSLLVEPAAGREVGLVDVTTSIVFVTEVGAGRGLGDAVPLEVYAARCDTHALIESKKTFTFTVSLAIDGGEPVPVELVPEDGPARDVLQQAIEGCLDAGGSG